MKPIQDVDRLRTALSNHPDVRSPHVRADELDAGTLFYQDRSLTFSDAEVRAWFEGTFDPLMAEEGAVLLIPGHRSELEDFRTRLRESLDRLRHQLREAGIIEVQPEQDLVGLYAGGEIRGFADLVLKNGSGERAIVDMKWSGAQKYPAKLKDNRHLQLAIYGEMLRQEDGAWPAVAYYVLKSGQLFSTDVRFFPSAHTVFPSTAERTPDLWQRFIATWKWRERQIAAGRFEVVLDGIPEDAESVVPEEGLPIEVLPAEYNDYLALAGWET